MIHRDIILASGSPRRKELLKQIGIDFKVCVADAEEKSDKTSPDELVMDLSYLKASAVYENGHCDDIVIGADTIVYAEGRVLGKPRDEADSRHMLNMLSGSSHEVYTGVTILYKDGSGQKCRLSFSEKTTVHVATMTNTEIDEYIATGEPSDKAGAYGIQGSFAKFIKGIEGDYNNVVGLPVAALYARLKEISVK